jgi:hypothetical protein
MEKMADHILLERVDRLFASGVGEHIPLPQIVVVGDQSSGKSSVLEVQHQRMRFHLQESRGRSC